MRDEGLQDRLGTPQKGGVIDPALVPVHRPHLPPIAVIFANVQPDSCMGMGELWRFSEAAKPHNMPPALRDHMTEEDYVAIMDGLNAVLDRHGAPKETDCFGQFEYRRICIDGPACGMLTILGLLTLPLIFPACLFEMDEAKERKKIKEEIEALVKEFPGVEVEIYFEWPLHVKVSLRRSLLAATASETPGRIASGLRIFDTRFEV